MSTPGKPTSAPVSREARALLAAHAVWEDLGPPSEEPCDEEKRVHREAWAAVLAAGAAAHAAIRRAAGELIEQGEDAGRGLILAALGAQFRPIPEIYQDYRIELASHCTIQAQVVAKLKRIHRFEAAIWRPDVDSVNALLRLHAEFCRVYVVASELIYQANEIGVYAHAAISPLVNEALGLLSETSLS